MLTGKAKSDFEKWLDEYSQKHHKNEWLDNDLYLDEAYLPDELMNALIIEWLDSVGIYVELNRATQGLKFQWWYYTLSDYRGIHLNNYLHNIVKVDNRTQATEQAIIKANEIYNSQ